MSGSPRLGPVVVLFVACFALIWWSWREPALAVAPGSAAPGAVPTADPASAAGGGPDAADGDRVEVPPQARSEADDSATSDWPVLRIRLVGLVRGAPWTSKLHIKCKGRDDRRDAWVEFEARLEVSEDGTASIALPPWTAFASRQKGHLEANDSNYQPLHHRFRGAIDSSAELVLDVQAIALLFGRVVDARGKAVVAARVNAFALHNGAPVEPQLGHTTTSREGRFRIRVPPGVPLLLVATPMQPMQLSGMMLTGEHGAVADLGVVRADLLPASREVHGALGTRTDVPDIVVPDAAMIRGIVRWQGGDPIEKARIGIRGSGGMLEVSANSAVRRAADGSMTLGAATWTDDDGRFELPTRPGIPIDLVVSEIEGCLLLADVVARGVLGPATPTIEVPAPVSLRPTRNGEHDGRVEIEGVSGSHVGKGRLVRVVTDRGHRARGFRGRHRSPWITFSAAQAGTIVDLPMTDDLTQVSIEFHGDFMIRNAQFVFRRRTPTANAPQPSTHRLTRGDNIGPFRLFVEPGSYVLEVGAAPGERNGTYLLPIRRHLDVGTTDLDLDLAANLGGTFQVDVTDATGLPVGGACIVRDRTGEDVTGRFRVHTANYDVHFGEPGELLDVGANDFDSMLPPGDYELELTFAHHGVQRRTIAIKPREVTEVRIRLP